MQAAWQMIADYAINTSEPLSRNEAHICLVNALKKIIMYGSEGVAGTTTISTGHVKGATVRASDVLTKEMLRPLAPRAPVSAPAPSSLDLLVGSPMDLDALVSSGALSVLLRVLLALVPVLGVVGLFVSRRVRVARTGILLALGGLVLAGLCLRTPTGLGSDVAGSGLAPVNAWSGAGLSLALSGFLAAALTADDFLPIVQAPEEQRAELSAVRQPESVKVEADAVLEQPVTSAATVQDAINAIVAERKQGCTMIAVPSGGYGFVATGIGTYRKNMDNVTAERIAQRNAYVEAYMQAKSQMASLLGDMAVRGVTTFDKKTETLDTDSKALRNQTRELDEHQKAVVYAVLKGYVTSEVHDDIDKGMVYVTLVSTPKTRGRYARPDSDTLIAPRASSRLKACEHFKT